MLRGEALLPVAHPTLACCVPGPHALQEVRTELLNTLVNLMVANGAFLHNCLQVRPQSADITQL